MNKFYENLDKEYTFVRTVEREPMPEFRAAARAPNIEVLVERLKLQELRERVRFHDLMMDFDPLRTGLISVPRFHACLNQGKVELSDREFRLLVDRYADENKKQDMSETHLYSKLDTSDAIPVIRWMDFYNDINEIYTTKGLEKTPLKETHGPSLSTLRNLSIIDPVYSEKNDKLKAILEEYHALVVQRRIFLKPTFHDYDRHNNGRITISQFTQAIKTVGFPLGSRIDVLYEHYRDMNVPTDVNYLAFLADVEADKLEEKKAAERAYEYNQKLEMENRAAELRREKRRKKMLELLSRPAADMILDFQQRFRARQIRWKDWFVDHDKLNTGYVLASRFRQDANMTGFDFTEIEFDFIKKYFCDDEDNHPGYINYVLWSDIMDEPFTTKGFEKDPHMQSTVIPIPKKKGVSVELTEEQEVLVAQAIARFHKYTIDRRVYLRPHLKDFDRLNNGHITRAQFRSSCGLLGLQFRSEDEQEAVVEKFCDSYGFLYYEFINACETGGY